VNRLPLLIGTAIPVLCAIALTASRQADVGWPMHGGDLNIRHSTLTQINRDNVAKLQVAWTYDSKDSFAGSEMQSHPVIVDGAMYLTTPTLKVVSLDATTGRSCGASIRRAARAAAASAIAA
jgi:quinoprotein glucose dehydrogenase